jgi:hypothetical protein
MSENQKYQLEKAANHEAYQKFLDANPALKADLKQLSPADQIASHQSWMMRTKNYS